MNTIFSCLPISDKTHRRAKYDVLCMMRTCHLRGEQISLLYGLYNRDRERLTIPPHTMKVLMALAKFSELTHGMYSTMDSDNLGAEVAGRLKGFNAILESNNRKDWKTTNELSRQIEKYISANGEQQQIMQEGQEYMDEASVSVAPPLQEEDFDMDRIMGMFGQAGDVSVRTFEPAPQQPMEFPEVPNHPLPVNENRRPKPRAEAMMA